MMHCCVFISNTSNILKFQKSSDPALVPVMVYIHGGAFVNGAGLVVNGTQLSMKGVTVVTLNYRLGALGFLSTEDQAAPGNFGLLDQLLALQWVQDNIQAFGGDPGRVTVFGDSAGSASVSLLLTSPLSKGLFHAAICESGVGLANWAVAMKTDVLRPRDRARLLGIGLGCIKATTQEVVDCLRTKDAEDINKAVVKIALDRLMWSPVVDTFYQTVPDLPINSWKNGKVMDVPVIRGTNSGEWAAYIAKIQGNHSGIKASFFLEQIHEYVHQRFFKNRKVIEDDIKMVYATPYNLSTPELVRDSFLQLVSDDLFTAPIVLETQLDAKLGGNGKTYFYVFSYVSKNTLPKWEGAPHGYEKAFVFGEPFNKVLDYSNYTDIDCFFSLTMMEMWTNFAKYGDPTPQPLYGARWEPFTSVYNQSYFLLDSSTPKSHQNFRYEATKLWNVVIPALKKTI
ncbi:neuroligin-4, X-linked [Patella vulgata]|uniref:neuroligin-4, X-linked n=1 Tax=Patella vulgata TaxID=6465 RepID=UPI0024A90DA2|nr:neuroligin-4, X-linked [Patella vulgata]